MKETLRKQKLSALTTVARRTVGHAQHCYDPLVINGYVRKKCAYILEAKTKGELDDILKPPKPRYNGNGFDDSPYQVDEEELICWSEASLRAPLNGMATKRYLQVMMRVFPRERLSSLEDIIQYYGEVE